MNKAIRSGFLLFAALTMTLSSIGGCASSGAAVGAAAPREIPRPSSEDLEIIQADTFVRIELLSGRIVEGVFLSYSPDEASVQFSMEHVNNALSGEFKDEGRVYRIPEEKIIKLTVLDPPENSKTIKWIAGIVIVVAGALALLYHSVYQADF